MSKVSIDVGDNKDNTAKLENIRIRDREMIPEWTISTTKATETLTNNETGQVMGISSSVVKTHTITLRPEEYYRDGGKNAEEDGSETKKTSK